MPLDEIVDFFLVIKLMHYEEKFVETQKYEKM